MPAYGSCCRDWYVDALYAPEKIYLGSHDWLCHVGLSESANSGVAIIGLALAIYTYQNLISASKKREVAAANNAGTTDDDEGDRLR